VTLIGAEGSRIDHMLGALQSAAKSGISVHIGYRYQMARVLVGPCSGDLAHTGLASLMPLTITQGVTLEGVEWPLVNAVLDPCGLTSLSNRALGKVEYSVDAGAAVLFWEHDGSPIWFDPF
jgi:thiamine pyrophosphokinase